MASEDARIRDFHRVDLHLPGLVLYRSGSPVHDLVKGKGADPGDPANGAKADLILGHLKTLGIRTIVSLEDPGEKEGAGSPAVLLERAAAGRAGITFLSNPMRNEKLKDMPPQAILAWLQAVETNLRASAPKGPVLVHCSAGHDRTGIVVAYLRITVDGWTADRAIEEMRALGHNWPKFSSDGGVSSWHETFLRNALPALAR